MIRERDESLAGSSNDVVIGDNVACFVPNEARAGASPNTHDIACPEVSDVIYRGNEDDGGARILEDANGPELAFGERTALRYAAGHLGAQIAEVRGKSEH